MRILKRIIIAGLIGGIVLLSVFLFSLISEKRPTCFDGIQNQGEEGIDCGGACEKVCEIRPSGEITVLFADTFFLEKKTYAAVAKIRNTDNDFGASRVSYEFQLYDARDTLLHSQVGFAFILPSSERYVVEPKILIQGEVDRAEFIIHEIFWERLKEYRGVPEFIIRDGIYRETPGGAHASEFSGILRNISGFDFDSITVTALLRGSGEEIRGAGTIEIKTMKSGEERYFKISWPARIEGAIVSVETFPETNVFLETNFIERHGTQERFQEFVQ